jgi:hypothetical protein
MSTHHQSYQLGVKMSDVQLVSNPEEYRNADHIDNVDHIVSIDNRSGNYIRHSLSDANSSIYGCEKIRQNDDATMTNIYRYKFTEDFMADLFTFSKVHQYDHRKDFKEAWIAWVDTNEDIVNCEILRLKRLGYDGDVLDKMFKSARYYFRKKSTEKKAPRERRDYVSVRKELLDAVDDHIKRHVNNANYKPSDGFDDFCKSHMETIKDEVTHLCRSGLTDTTEIKTKIKKTYKNRYFLVIRK